ETRYSSRSPVWTLQ
nr:immunoglobulin heavy chain junction region [Mus musculus]